MTHTIKALGVAAAIAMAAGAGITTASAMPLASGLQTADQALVQTVGWRCGPGRHMSRFGCVPNRPWGRPWRRW